MPAVPRPPQENGGDIKIPEILGLTKGKHRLLASQLPLDPSGRCLQLPRVAEVGGNVSQLGERASDAVRSKKAAQPLSSGSFVNLSPKPNPEAQNFKRRP